MKDAVPWLKVPPENLLVERFHITGGFHSGQRDIIERLVQGKQRVLAIQRTGWGKSLCYQMASLYFPHLTIVFSPLKALMRDQYQRCNDVYAIPAAIVSSDFSQSDNRVTLERAVSGELKLLYIAPERLNNMLWQDYVKHMYISMIVIDEAHCISTWGHDFRPDYRRIVNLLNAIPDNIPVLALTATANKRVEQDILQQVGANVAVIRGTMQRPNLHLNVVPVQGNRGKLSYLGEILPCLPGTGIIYTATRRDAEMVATFLQQQGIASAYYHAGREDENRRDIEQRLMANGCKAVCSTNALGMGIDKPDVRFIIHYQIPASPIHYYQEMGRAGRDRQPACCILLYDPEDLGIQKHFIQNACPESASYEAILRLLRMNPQGKRQGEIMRQTGFSKTVVRTILAHLEEQQLIEQDSSVHIAISYAKRVDLSDYDNIRAQKLHELNDIKNYASWTECYMGYLTAYLGDRPRYRCGVCGHCSPRNFPLITPSARMQQIVDHFLDEECLPIIEKKGSAKAPQHEAGWSLSFHGNSPIGKLVRASKYEGAGPFDQQLVEQAVKIIRKRYPVNMIDGIVSVPPTISGTLVEDFARKVAFSLGIAYLPVLKKIRKTQEQKYFTNYLQKTDNVKGAFGVSKPDLVNDRILLLIDDIYDSGHMLREIGRTLMRAGAKCIYPFTITRTAHSDDQ